MCSVFVGLSIYFIFATCSAFEHFENERTTVIKKGSAEVSDRIGPVVLPHRYFVHLKVWLPNLVFTVPPESEFKLEGTLFVALQSRQLTNKIQLNAHKSIKIDPSSVELKLNRNPFEESNQAYSQTFNQVDDALPAKVWGQKWASGEDTKNALEQNGLKHDFASEIVDLTFSRQLFVGQHYILKLKYTGVINDGLTGFYRSSFNDTNNTLRWLAVTQFETGSARKALPCFDEPSYKAVFDIAIEHPADTNAVSNGEILNSVNISDGWRRTDFAASPKMSSYLLAFLVAPFTNVQTKTSDGKITVRSWGPPSMSSELEYSVKTASKLLLFFQKRFNMPYPMSKLDQVFLADFRYGAMENWGLVTYKEQLRNKFKTIDLVTAHELAHQWLGNFVTMKWWSHIWLNEGFANYMEKIGLQELGYDIEEHIHNNIAGALYTDQLPSSHPIIYSAINAKGAQFGSITYSKGGSLLRMLNYTVGEGLFTKALRHYLQVNKYKNTETDDLWHSFAETLSEVSASAVKSWTSAPFSVKQFMDPWTLQYGFPSVTVVRHYSGNKNGTLKFSLTQKPCQLPTLSGYQSDEYRWIIPIWWQTAATGISSLEWLASVKENYTVTTSVHKSSDHNWLIVNPQRRGFFRVNYDDQNWNMIIGALSKDPNVLDYQTRMMLLDDSDHFSKIGVLSPSVYKALKGIHSKSIVKRDTNDVAATQHPKFSTKYKSDMGLLKAKVA